MRLLMLGGTRFVGRAIVREALARGWEVGAVHRGVAGALPEGVTSLLADRTAPGELARVLDGETWDLVLDTWDGAPRVAAEAAELLRGRVPRYGYVSSMSVYVWGSHVDENSPVVAGDASADVGEYPALKRGAELGVLAAHPDALLARAGLILGPHEDIGRLPWWLQRISRGGRVMAPGRPAPAAIRRCSGPGQLVPVRPPHRPGRPGRRRQSLGARHHRAAVACLHRGHRVQRRPGVGR